jgi:CHASE3 domain sensor protein
MKSIAWLGNQQMEHIRAIIYQLQLEEQTLLKEWSQERNARYAALNTIMVTSLVIAFLLVVYGFITYTRENKARRSADQTVFQYQEQLKDRVNNSLTQSDEWASQPIRLCYVPLR